MASKHKEDEPVEEAPAEAPKAEKPKEPERVEVLDIPASEPYPTGSPPEPKTHSEAPKP